MSRDDHELGEHEAAIRSLQENQQHLLRRVDLLMVMVVASLANIPITLVM